MNLYNDKIVKQSDNPVVLSREMELSLIERHNNGGPDATVELIASLQHVINFMVNNKSKNYQDKEDVRQSAMIGCIRAIESFDPTKNTRLSTIAKLYIRSEVDDYLNKNSRPSTIYKTKDERKVYYNAIAMTPCDVHPLESDNICNLSDELGVDKDVVRDVLGMMVQGSCEVPVDYHTDDQEYDECFGSVNKARNSELLSENLMTLDDMEKDIFIRYHLDLESLKDIGSRYGVTPQAIHSIKNKTLLKLKKQMNDNYNEVSNG